MPIVLFSAIYAFYCAKIEFLHSQYLIAGATNSSHAEYSCLSICFRMALSTPFNLTGGSGCAG
jgi:hypothetical protein